MHVARILLQASGRHHSVTLEANAQHLMTDVWTSAGVIVGVSAVALTGWLRLDPVVALIVAANIVWAGVKIVRESALGLMDTALPTHEHEAVQAAVARHCCDGVEYHALRTRQSGARRFVSLHVLVPGDWTVQKGHDWSERIEGDIRGAVPHANVTTHLEPQEDPISHADALLDR